MRVSSTVRLLTPAEVCERYDISLQTLYNWRTLGTGLGERHVGDNAHAKTAVLRWKTEKGL